jgi:hypothetical protein
LDTDVRALDRIIDEIARDLGQRAINKAFGEAHAVGGKPGNFTKAVDCAAQNPSKALLSAHCLSRKMGQFKRADISDTLLGGALGDALQPLLR